MASYNWVMYSCGCTEGIGVPEDSICKLHKKPIAAVNKLYKSMCPDREWEIVENADSKAKPQKLQGLPVQHRNRK
jgi:hypothetical protein